MARRMQVLIDDAEYRKIQRVAKRKRLTLAEWVRQALRDACREAPEGDPGKKLAVIRESATHHYPTADIEQILSDIEDGYGQNPAE